MESYEPSSHWGCYWLKRSAIHPTDSKLGKEWNKKNWKCRIYFRIAVGADLPNNWNFDHLQWQEVVMLANVLGSPREPKSFLFSLHNDMLYHTSKETHLLIKQCQLVSLSYHVETYMQRHRRRKQNRVKQSQMVLKLCHGKVPIVTR